MSKPRSIGASDATIVLRHISRARSRPSSSTSRAHRNIDHHRPRACRFSAWARSRRLEWGAMLNEARSEMMTAPHVAIFPAIAIFVTVLAFNLLGDGLRDALDPKVDQK
jgi:glutathione transport system permease protein